MLTPEQVQAYRSQYGLDGNKPAAAPKATGFPPAAPVTPRGPAIPTRPSEVAGPLDVRQPMPMATPAPAPQAEPDISGWIQGVQDAASGKKTPPALKPQNIAHQQDRMAQAKALGIQLPENDTRMNGVKQGVAANLPGAAVDGFKTYGVNVAKDMMAGGEEIKGSSERFLKGEQSNWSTILQNLGTVAKTAFAPINEVITPALHQAADTISGTKVAQDIATAKPVAATTDVVNTGTQRVSDEYTKWAKVHPIAAKNLEASVNIGMLLGGEGPAEEAVTTAAKVAKGTTDAVTAVSKDVAGQVTAGAKKLPTAFKSSPEALAAKADKLTGQVIQGAAEDIPRAQKALRGVDTSKVKTYGDLASSLDTKVKTVAKQIDDAYATDTTPHKLTELGLKKNVGGTEVNHNYVDDALNHLTELYQKTNDPTALAEVKQLRLKAQEQGLTAKEVNDLARQYGSEFDSKAFSKRTGDPLTNVNAQALENTRTGIKDTARSLFDDPTVQAADLELSNTIKTRDLATKMAEKVQALEQKSLEAGWGAKVGNLVAHFADTVSGGAIKGILKYFLKDAGKSTANALELQSILQKNLKALDKILGGELSPSEVQKQLQEIIDSGPRPVPVKPAAPVEVPRETVRAADLPNYPAEFKKLQGQDYVKVNGENGKPFKLIPKERIQKIGDRMKQWEQQGKNPDLKLKPVQKRKLPVPGDKVDIKRVPVKGAKPTNE